MPKPVNHASECFEHFGYFLYSAKNVNKDIQHGMTDFCRAKSVKNKDGSLIILSWKINIIISITKVMGAKINFTIGSSNTH